ncbi:uncharacterized protein LOC116020915 [Ipomoea triloba]|uniref:uncharacterized protein LOC116020915 n=1 Tax=Ipomoea triloba TaxID=35885 RepID=UPI00125E15AF|nr:uncharacterized protein LOC116020915 [Ipomoea triloba]
MDERRKRIAAALTLFLKMYTTVSSFLLLMASTVSRPRINRRYSLNFYEKREYVRRIVYDNDESCISLLRMNRKTFFKLCVVLEKFRLGNRARSESNSDSLSSGGRRKRKISDRDESITSQSFHNAAMMLSETLIMVGDKLSKSIGTELTLQEKVQQLDKELIQIDGLSNEEYLMALIKLPDRPNKMLVFFSLPPERRLEWVRAFLAT